MDSVLLRTFLEVSKTRNFGRAAQNLFMTQSAIGFRIRHLEEVVGCPLFHRKRNNLTLTSAGERLIPYAEGILASWNTALQDIGLSDKQSTLISIGGTANIWDTFLQRKLPELAAVFTSISLRTDVSSQVQLVQSVLARNLDMGLVFDPPRSAGINVDKVAGFELILVSHEKGINFSEIGDKGYVSVDWGTAFNVQHARLFEQPVIPLLQTGQSYIAREFLARKGGVAYLPEALVRKHLNTKKLFVVEEAPAFFRDVFAIYPDESDKKDIVTEIIDFLASS